MRDAIFINASVSNLTWGPICFHSDFKPFCGLLFFPFPYQEQVQEMTASVRLADMIPPENIIPGGIVRWEFPAEPGKNAGHRGV